MKYFFLFVVFSLTLPAFAQEIDFDSPVIGGSGCSLESTSLLISDQSITLGTQNLRLVGKPKSTGRTTCLLSAPVKIPQGKKLVIAEIEMSGLYKLTKKSKATVNAEVFFAGGRGKKVVKVLGSQRTVSQGELSIVDSNLTESACGQETILRINASVILSSAKKIVSDEAISIDQLALKLRLVDCN